MACREWNNDWIAHLYAELDGPEEQQLNEHVTGCADCRQTLEQLAGSRRLLQASAPAVPTPPRVVMIQPRRLARPFWTFAFGLACAMLVFVVGLLAGGGQFLAPGPQPTTIDADLVTRAELDELLRAQEGTLETRLAAFASRPAPAQRDSEICLTREQFASQLETELERYRQEVDYTQERDFRILAGQIGAVEQRAASWIDENRDALRLALHYRGVDEH